MSAEFLTSFSSDTEVLRSVWVSDVSASERVAVMEASSFFKDCSSVAPSPLSSPNISTLLKIKVLSWSQETGLPASVCIRLCDRNFNLHKQPLFSKSGYFKKRLQEAKSNEFELPRDFPGGTETFELILLFLYEFPMSIDPFNIAALRCAAEFLELTEEHSSKSLCERFDRYLNQVVLQSWDDTLVVLRKCQVLLSWSEDVLIVSRCIESLAFMACMEILDPERRREKPVATLEGLADQAWSCERAKKILNDELWIKDLMALPFKFFARIIASLRRQGMKEKHVSPIILFYANEWILSPEESRDNENSEDGNRMSEILQCISDLLPSAEKANRSTPVGFYFALISRALRFALRGSSMKKLQDLIVSSLHIAHIEDFLYPETGKESSAKELLAMQEIFADYVLVNSDSSQTPSAGNTVVAELWDMYLSRIAHNQDMNAKKFVELIETVPISLRQSHDQLYTAVSSFLKAHRDISPEDKGLVCKYLNCQKLSQAVCIDAVQNDLMPLRLIVQALFVQQMNTHQAFKECTDSFHFTHLGDFSGSLTSSRCPNSRPLDLKDSPCTDGAEARSRPLSFLMQKDAALEDFESTSFRIQNLEQELRSLKTTLQWQNSLKKTTSIKLQSTKQYGLEKRSLSKKRNPVGQVTGCIGSVNFSSQRKYATKLFRVIRRVALFGIRRSKRKENENDLWAKSV